jgi:two-component system chemotaxis response regulator CheY
MPAKRVLSIGQCLADHGSISRLLRREFAADVMPADTADEALARLRQEEFALVLVNRVLDGDGSSGVDIIRRLKADEALRSVPVMLVSNYEDAQQEAIQEGAERGFGKGQLSSPTTAARLRRFLEEG